MKTQNKISTEDILNLIPGLNVDFPKVETGFIVSFERKVGRTLYCEHFPSIDDNILIDTEEKAWEIAKQISEITFDNDYESFVNIYVTNEKFSPVDGYREKSLNYFQ